MAQQAFDAMRSGTEQLCLIVQKEIIKLQQATSRQKQAAEMEEPNPEFQLMSLPLLPQTASLDPKMIPIWCIVEKLKAYEHVMLNDKLPIDRKERYHLLKKLQSTGFKEPVAFYSCTHSGNHENLIFLWKCNNEEGCLQNQADIIAKVQQSIPKYHSRFVKTNFVKAASRLHIKPMYARILYQMATDDASSAETCDQSLINDRIMEYVKTEDPEIVLDLRALHTNPVLYEDFFNVAAAIIEESIGTAVDERRHTSVIHMATAMSGSELYR